MASVNDKLERVRKPRVHIKYEVETEGAVQEKELPFVVGVMGDYVGNASGAEAKPLKDRKFTNVDRDNVDDVMAKMEPGLTYRVDNTLADDGSEMAVELKFNSMQDFEPAKVVEQVPALKQMMDVRNKLRDLLSKTDRSFELETILENTLKDPAALKALARELGVETTTEDKE